MFMNKYKIYILYVYKFYAYSCLFDSNYMTSETNVKQ